MKIKELSLKPQPSNLLRWTALLLISLAMMGNYYIYDSISPLADLLKTQLGFSDSNIGLLNAIYSFPNIIMVLIGGLLIDRIGTKRSVLIFTSFIMLGSVKRSKKLFGFDGLRPGYAESNPPYIPLEFL